MINVIKRNGAKEPIDIEKIHRVCSWATEGLTDTSASEIAIKSQIQFYPDIKTKTIQEMLIKSAAGLISETNPNYQYAAGRLINYHLRKEVYGGPNPIKISELVRRNINLGFYDPDLVGLYSESEWEKIDSFINHSLDMQLTYAAMEQFRGKYLVRDRIRGEILETPQIAYILIAAILFSKYPQESRLSWVKDYYDAISQHTISLPTPIMAGLRTPQRQLSSCVVIECGDSLDSITATSTAIVKYVSQRAGIGIGAGSLRAINSPIRNGDTLHTGVIPFYRLFEASVQSCSQGAVRKGSATLYYPIWHLEVEDLLVLKNNKGTEESRVRNIDYGVQINRLFYERLIAGGDITLFSPHDIPEAYEAFFNDYALFKQLYESAEKDPNIRQKKLKAIDLFSAFMQERKDTGRIYLMNTDHCNLHSSFIESQAPIRQSNLCCEITLPTQPVRGEGGGATQLGRVSLCTLSAINWGNIKQPSDFERPCQLAVRALDELLDYQAYPLLEAKLATQEYRPLGIGIINLAYWLAKNGLKYSDDSSLKLLDEYAEAWSFYLIKASMELAKEKGACFLNKNTKYSQGILPIDTRKREIDELIPHEERLSWGQLREDLIKYGIRNATLMALMPSETSSQIANATNGIEPPRAYVSIKQSKDGILAQVVPKLKKLKNKYELLWEQKSPLGYLNICSILQKYVDQAISVNTSYNPKFYPGGKIPMSELLGHILYFYKMGGKNLYYFNTHDGAGELSGEKLIAECDSCKI